jgi:hypothetical protein
VKEVAHRVRGLATDDQLDQDAAPCSAHDLLGLEERLALIQAALERIEAANSRPKQEFLSVQDAVTVLGLKSAKLVYAALRRGELKHSNLSSDEGATYRIHHDDLRAWVDSKQVKTGRPRSERQALVQRYYPDRKRA